MAAEADGAGDVEEIWQVGTRLISLSWRDSESHSVIRRWPPKMSVQASVDLRADADQLRYRFRAAKMELQPESGWLTSETDRPHARIPNQSSRQPAISDRSHRGAVTRGGAFRKGLDHPCRSDVSRAQTRPYASPVLSAFHSISLLVRSGWRAQGTSALTVAGPTTSQCLFVNQGSWNDF